MCYYLIAREVRILSSFNQESVFFVNVLIKVYTNKVLESKRGILTRGSDNSRATLQKVESTICRNFFIYWTEICIHFHY